MKIKNKGRKIYKTKEKNYYGKTPVGRFFSAVLTVILIAGVGVLGYSVAGPMIDYSRKQGDEESEAAAVITEDIQETTGESSEIPVETVVYSQETYRGVRLTEYEISGTEAIKTAIGRIPSGQDIEYIEIPLKLADGRIMYATQWSEFPELSAAEITLDEIVSAVRKEGYKPAAYISVFADNLIPEQYSQYGFMDTEDLTAWHDADGNTWGSPFSEAYTRYVDFIAEEISGAGFEKIICGNLKFPDFTERDLIILDDSRLENHAPSLNNITGMLYNAITSGGADMIVEVTAADVLSGKAEILDITEKNTAMILDIDLDGMTGGVNTGSTVYEFNGTPTENISKMLDLAGGYISGYDVIVRLSGNSCNTSDLLRAVDDMAENGYNSFILG